MGAVTSVIGMSSAQANAQSRRATKTLTFDGSAGLGAVGAVPLFTVTGDVLVIRIMPYCTVDLVGATATLALGVTGSTTLFIAATTATTIDAGLGWFSITPVDSLALPAALKEIAVSNNIIGTVAVAAVTAGAVRFDVDWEPLSADGNVV